MTEQEIIALLDKYENGLCTAQEAELLERWYIAKASASADEVSPADLWIRKESSRDFIMDQVAGKTTTRRSGLLKLWPRIASIAAAVAAITLGVWFYTYRSVVNRNSQIVNQNDVKPGRNRATLTLPDGSIMQLSDAKTGVIIDASKLTYNDGSNVDSLSSLRGGTTRQSHDEIASSRNAPRNDGRGDNEMLTANTPRGGTYQFTLPDGTKVWLNAASSLKFPSSFTGVNSRKVELAGGEAYFEVAKNIKVPFIVISKGQEVEVLGTHFNINAYADELSTKTTLLEGSVRVSSLDMNGRHPEFISGSRKSKTTQQGIDPGLRGGDGKSNDDGVVLTPNQQAINTGKAIKVTQVKPELAVDWKNGDFIFDGENIESMMRKIARWYNIEVEYQGKVPNEILVGKVSRTKNISQVLKALEAMRIVHFKIEGRKVIVTQ